MLFPQLTNASSSATLVPSPLQKSQSAQERNKLQAAAPEKRSAVQAAAASASSPAPAASASSADTITSSDFLTLLVTELKNQDPTSDQDPNAYINQLVGVNSLQQLISINQDLTPSTATSTTPATPPSILSSAQAASPASTA